MKITTRSGRIVAGIFALIGGALPFAFTILLMFLLIFGSGLEGDILALVAFGMYMIMGPLAVVGGILILARKKSGGFLTLIGGAGGLICWLLLFIDYSINPLSFILDLTYLLQTIFFLLVPGALILIGGIVSITTSPES